MKSNCCESIQIKYGFGSDATLVTVLEEIKGRVDQAIFSEHDDPLWPDLIKDYREVANMLDSPCEMVSGF